MIRPVREEDWAQVYEIYAWYVKKTVWNFEWTPQSLEDFTAKQKEFAWDYPYFVAEHEGKIIGYGLAHAAFGRISYQFDAELTIYFMPGPHYGMASAMLENICTVLEAQNIRWLIGCITASNETSIAFHKKHGFVYQGLLPEAGWKNGAFHDVVWYGKTIHESSWFTRQERAFIPLNQLDLNSLNIQE